MNNINISGNLGKDAELNYTTSNKAVCKFSVGVARGYKKEDGTDWLTCTLFGDRAEKLSGYLVKGTKVLVTGKLRINTYDKKDGTKGYSTEILVGEIELLGGKKQESAGAFPNIYNEDYTPVEDDSDVPF